MLALDQAVSQEASPDDLLDSLSVKSLNSHVRVRGDGFEQLGASYLAVPKFHEEGFQLSPHSNGVR
jgi:hypothetical protein